MSRPPWSRPAWWTAAFAMALCLAVYMSHSGREVLLLSTLISSPKGERNFDGGHGGERPASGVVASGALSLQTALRQESERRARQGLLAWGFGRDEGAVESGKGESISVSAYRFGVEGSEGQNGKAIADPFHELRVNDGMDGQMGSIKRLNRGFSEDRARAESADRLEKKMMLIRGDVGVLEGALKWDSESLIALKEGTSEEQMELKDRAGRKEVETSERELVQDRTRSQEGPLVNRNEKTEIDYKSNREVVLKGASSADIHLQRRVLKTGRDRISRANVIQKGAISAGAGEGGEERGKESENLLERLLKRLGERHRDLKRTGESMVGKKHSAAELDSNAHGEGSERASSERSDLTDREHDASQQSLRKSQFKNELSEAGRSSSYYDAIWGRHPHQGGGPREQTGGGSLLHMLEARRGSTPLQIRGTARVGSLRAYSRDVQMGQSDSAQGVAAAKVIGVGGWRELGRGVRWAMIPRGGMLGGMDYIKQVFGKGVGEG